MSARRSLGRWKEASLSHDPPCALVSLSFSPFAHLSLEVSCGGENDGRSIELFSFDLEMKTGD